MKYGILGVRFTSGWRMSFYYEQKANELDHYYVLFN